MTKEARSAAIAFRRMQPEDFARVLELTLQAFSGDDAERKAVIAAALEQAYRSADIMKWEHGYVAEDRGRIVSKAQLLDLPMRLGCVTLRVAGFHALVTDPEVAARSLLLPMVRYGFEHVRAQGFDIGLGFTQHPGIFRLIGGVTVAAECDWEIEPANIPASGTPLDDFHAARPDEVGRLIELSARDSQDRVLSLVRNESIWQQLERRPSELWLSRDSYLGLRRSPVGIEVRDVGVAHAGAYPRALAFLGELARRDGATKIFGEWPEDHGLVREATALGGKSSSRFVDGKGCMAGIIDFSAFLRRIAPELARRAAKVTSESVSIELDCEGQRHALVLGESASHQTPVSFRGSRGLWLRLVLGSGAPQLLVANERGARLEATPTLLDALFGARHPFTGVSDRW